MKESRWGLPVRQFRPPSTTADRCRWRRESKDEWGRMKDESLVSSFILRTWTVNAHLSRTEISKAPQTLEAGGGFATATATTAASSSAGDGGSRSCVLLGRG